jgi:hypothetical protein
MGNIQYHKGQGCIVKPVLCQEGYCSECYIYQSKFSRIELTNRGLWRSVETNPKLTGLVANRV